MRTKKEIEQQIKKYEYMIGQLLDKQQEEDDIYQLEAYSTMINAYRKDIKQLLWVLNE